jgi:hypothetical protein
MTTQYCALSDTVCIEARGSDAGAFLHGQLSGAVAELEPSTAPLAAWLDARGRVRALVRVHRLRERWLLVTPRDGAEALVKKLRMFVLRAAVTLDVAADVAVGAVLGGDAAALAALGVPADAGIHRTIVAPDGCRWTLVGPGYWQVVGPPASTRSLAAALATAPPESAALAAIRLGIPPIGAAQSERFVAQMLNLDLLGAVSFDKGCYPGQEIVARVHNLGGVKRRTRRYAAAVPPLAAGTAVQSGERAVGEVLASAPTEAGCELLALVDNEAADDALTSGGAPLEEQPLPFAVPRD